MFRTLSRGQLAFDVIAPALLFLLLVAPYLDMGMGLVLLGMCATLVLWRLSPGLSLTVAWGTAILQMAAGLTADPANLAAVVALFASSAYGSPRIKWLGFASTFLGAAAATAYLGYLQSGIALPLDSALLVFAASLTLFLLSWTLGILSRALGASRASRLAQTVAEEERRGAEQQTIVEQERIRIARDMHDVVAHSLAVVIAQADGARYARTADPDTVDSSLSTIAQTARAALVDVRILLGQLRHSEGSHGEAPQPVLDDLGGLLDQFRESGLTVVLDEEGRRLTLGAAQQIAVYRVVQECLTNALRHGDTAHEVAVHLEWGADAVRVTVSNSTIVPPLTPLTPGHGIVGMRERAALSGGTLTAGAVADAFVVRAVLPVLGRDRQ